MPRQIEGASKLQLNQIRGSRLNQSQREHNRQMEKRDKNRGGPPKVAGSIHRSDQDQFIRCSVKKGEGGKEKQDSPF